MRKLQNIYRLILFSLVIIFMVVSPMEGFSSDSVNASTEQKESKKSDNSQSEISISKVYQTTNLLKLDFSEAEFLPLTDFQFETFFQLNSLKDHSVFNFGFRKILFTHYISPNAP